MNSPNQHVRKVLPRREWLEEQGLLSPLAACGSRRAAQGAWCDLSLMALVVVVFLLFYLRFPCL